MLALIGLACVIVGILAFGFFATIGGKEKGVAKGGIAVGLIAFVLCSGLGAGVMFGYPEYLVWQQEKEGEAALAKASQDRQIKVQEAEAEKEAALAQAEANKTLGESIRAYPESMEQKWVEAIKETRNQVVYLPTEASIPVTEASRIASKQKEEK